MKNNSTDYKMIEGYEAIYFKKFNKIECLLQNLDKDYYENLCELFTDYELNNNYLDKQIPPEVHFKNDFNVKLSIGYGSCSFINILKTELNTLIFNRKEKYGIFTLKISKVKCFADNDLEKLLRKIGNSLLFKILISTDLTRLAINLHRDIANKIKNSFSAINDLPNECDRTENFSLKKMYKSEPASFFLKANNTQESRFYQFILYYHCLEYFFINNGNYKCEEQQLENLLNECFNDAKDIKKYINKNKYLENYYFKKVSPNYSDLIDKPITTGVNPSNEEVKIKKIAERIYKLRNAIVHKKLGRTKLYPNLKSFQLLRNDIELLRFIAKKVIIKKSNKNKEEL